MTRDIKETPPRLQARIAGVLYLVIITFGLYGEMVVRSGLIVPGDPEATALNIVASPGLFRLGFGADAVMVLSDVALAVLLFLLLKPVNKAVALVMMCFRLVQSVILALNLLFFHAALLLLNGYEYRAAFEENQLNTLAFFFLEVHAHGYDLGLLFFGVSCLLLGFLVHQSHYLPKFLGVLSAAAGLTYLVGSCTRFLFPDHVGTISPIYIVAILSEVSLCLWLLIKGVNLQAWDRMTRNLPPAHGPGRGEGRPSP